MAVERKRGRAECENCVLDALAHERRRTAVAVLENAGTPLSEADLAVEIARRETESRDHATYERAESILVDLHHWHVPKLSDVGLVDFDPDRRTVALAEEVSTTVTGERRAPQRA